MNPIRVRTIAIVWTKATTTPANVPKATPVRIAPHQYAPYVYDYYPFDFTVVMILNHFAVLIFSEKNHKLTTAFD